VADSKVAVRGEQPTEPELPEMLGNWYTGPAVTTEQISIDTLLRTDAVVYKSHPIQYSVRLTVKNSAKLKVESSAR